MYHLGPVVLSISSNDNGKKYICFSGGKIGDKHSPSLSKLSPALPLSLF